MKKTTIKEVSLPRKKEKVTNDFFLCPATLAAKDDTVKVTLMLTRASIEYFKKTAEEHDTCYQALMRSLLDEYARHFSGE